MKAVRCVEGNAAVVDVARPSGEGVVVKVASAGICGSDLHLLPMGLPLTFGHEFAGITPDGRAVAVEPLAPCGTCAPCVAGDYHQCTLGPGIVFGVGHDGGMAEECLVPEAALGHVDPLAVAVHGVRRGGITGGQRVAVIGGGTIGQTALVAAQATGATVDLVARHDRQREAAARLGGGEATDGYDVVIEAAGTASALADAARRCRPGGTIVLLASYWDGTVEMPGLEVCMKEISLVPAVMYSRSGPSRDIDVAAAVLAARPELADAIITHRFPLDAAAEAFATAADRAAGAIKVVLEP